MHSKNTTITLGVIVAILIAIIAYLIIDQEDATDPRNNSNNEVSQDTTSMVGNDTSPVSVTEQEYYYNDVRSLDPNDGYDSYNAASLYNIALSRIQSVDTITQETIKNHQNATGPYHTAGNSSEYRFAIEQREPIVHIQGPFLFQDILENMQASIQNYFVFCVDGFIAQSSTHYNNCVMNRAGANTQNANTREIAIYNKNSFSTQQEMNVWFAKEYGGYGHTVVLMCRDASLIPYNASIDYPLPPTNDSTTEYSKNDIDITMYADCEWINK